MVKQSKLPLFTYNFRQNTLSKYRRVPIVGLFLAKMLKSLSLANVLNIHIKRFHFLDQEPINYAAIEKSLKVKVKYTFEWYTQYI